MRILSSIFFYLICVLSFFVGTAITIVLSWFSKDKPAVFKRSAHIWARFLAVVSFIPVKIEGLKNYPKGEAVVIVSNHQGAADIPLLLAYLPESFLFIIKKELFAIPIFGWYMRRAGYISIERGEGDKARKMLKEAKAALRSGNNILVFPEGTRSPDGHLHKFKRGSLLLAQLAKVRVVPVAVSGSYHILPTKTYFYNIVPVKISIGKPVSLEDFNGDYEKALEHVFGDIKNRL